MQHFTPLKMATVWEHWYVRAPGGWVECKYHPSSDECSANPPLLTKHLGEKNAVMFLWEPEIPQKWSLSRRPLKTPYKTINTACTYALYIPPLVYTFQKQRTRHQSWYLQPEERQTPFYFACSVHWEGEGFGYEYWAGKQERRHPGLNGGKLK